MLGYSACLRVSEQALEKLVIRDHLGRCCCVHYVKRFSSSPPHVTGILPVSCMCQMIDMSAPSQSGEVGSLYDTFLSKLIISIC